MAKLSDRLQQNPMNLKSNEKSKLNNKLQLNSNAPNQDDSHNNEDDDDF